MAGVTQDLRLLAEQTSLAQTRPRVTAVYEFIRDEVLKAAADGYTHMDLHVSDQWYHDHVNAKLVEAVLRNEGIEAQFQAGKWKLDWRA